MIKFDDRVAQRKFMLLWQWFQGITQKQFIRLIVLYLIARWDFRKFCDAIVATSCGLPHRKIHCWPLRFPKNHWGGFWSFIQLQFRLWSHVKFKIILLLEMCYSCVAFLCCPFVIVYINFYYLTNKDTSLRSSFFLLKRLSRGLSMCLTTLFHLISWQSNSYKIMI